MKKILAASAAVAAAALVATLAPATAQNNIPTGSMQSPGQGGAGPPTPGPNNTPSTEMAPRGGPSTTGAGMRGPDPGAPPPNAEIQQNIPPKGNVGVGSSPAPAGPTR